jgi:hypothetical protein
MSPEGSHCPRPSSKSNLRVTSDLGRLHFMMENTIVGVHTELEERARGMRDKSQPSVLERSEQ